MADCRSAAAATVRSWAPAEEPRSKNANSSAQRKSCRRLDTQNHHLSGLDEGGGGLAGLEIHFAGGAGGDDRGDLLATDGEFYFGHEAAYPHAVDATDQLIASTDAADHIAAFLLGFAAGAKKQAIDLVLWDAMMAARSRHAADSLLVDPLFERGETDAELQSGIAQVQQRGGRSFPGLLLVPALGHGSASYSPLLSRSTQRRRDAV